jgi:hypothetical protein
MPLYGQYPEIHARDKDNQKCLLIVVVWSRLHGEIGGLVTHSRLPDGRRMSVEAQSIPLHHHTKTNLHQPNFNRSLQFYVSGMSANETARLGGHCLTTLSTGSG